MSKYISFDNEPKKVSKFCKMINTKREDDRRIQKMPQPSSALSPYNKITEFSSKTKVICTKTDLSMFLESSKAIFVGDISTGKTSLINRLVVDFVF